MIFSEDAPAPSSAETARVQSTMELPLHPPSLAPMRRRPTLRLRGISSFILVCSPLVAALAADPVPLTTARPEVIAWIDAHAIPLTTVEAGHDFSDLTPLRALIGDARIVALGEPTHGSSEVFQLKHRLVEYLVSELGFDVFAIEANMPGARRVDDYVSSGRGDPVELIEGMGFWTWSTEEVRALVEDLRAFNLAPAHLAAGRHVEFTGFDMQDPRIGSRLIRDYIAAHDAEFLPTVDAAIAALPTAPSGTPDSFGFTPPRPLELWRAIEARLTGSTKNPSAADAAWIAQCARLIVQWLAADASPPTPRDESMARNVEWLLSQNPRAKIILWAHNQHVKRAPEAMGGYLSQRLGGELVAIGFATGRGTYRARAQHDRALGPFPLQVPPADSIESALAATHLPLFLLDLRPVRQAQDAWWLLANRPFRALGSMELTEQFQPTLIGRDYDVLAWIEETSPTVPLAGGWPPPPATSLKPSPPPQPKN